MDRQTNIEQFSYIFVVFENNLDTAKASMMMLIYISRS